jgi:hypothetical protein
MLKSLFGSIIFIASSFRKLEWLSMSHNIKDAGAAGSVLSPLYLNFGYPLP